MARAKACQGATTDTYRPCPNTGQVLVQGAKVRKHRVSMFGQARVTARHVPRTTCCRHGPTLPSKHGNTKHFSSCAQLGYHSIACILIDRHQIDPLANLTPHLEELDMFAFWAGLGAGSEGSLSEGEGDRMGKVIQSWGLHGLVHDHCTHTQCECNAHLM
jgi:hypothetical protein